MQPACSILIVDDDPDDVFLLRRALRGAGDVVGSSARIKNAGNGAEAFAVLAELEVRDDLPDVVTVDLNMPVMDGIGFLKRLRGTPTLSGLRTVVVTTSVECDVHADAMDAGADEILVKPQTEAAIFDVAERLLSYCRTPSGERYDDAKSEMESLDLARFGDAAGA